MVLEFCVLGYSLLAERGRVEVEPLGPFFIYPPRRVPVIGMKGHGFPTSVPDLPYCRVLYIVV